MRPEGRRHSSITQVKGLSPEIHTAEGQGVEEPEANTGMHEKKTNGECIEPPAGVRDHGGMSRKVCTETWETLP